MPSMKTFGIRWNVGSDDFTLPALVAILIRLMSLCLAVGVVMYFYFGPEGCPGNGSIPPILYVSLFAKIFVIAFAVIIDNIIFSISLKGSITNGVHKRKWLPFCLILRICFIVVEIVSIVACMVALFGPAAIQFQCSEFHDGPLLFARVIVIILTLTLVVYFIIYAIYLDPCGLFCSPSLQEDLEVILSSNRYTAECEHTEYAKQTRLGQLHTSHVGYGRIFRKLNSLFCCCARNESHVTALREMALAFHTIFSDLDMVPFDLVAGLKLLGRYQEKEQRKCLSQGDIEGYYLHREFRQVTLDNMPEDQKPADYISAPMAMFNSSSIAELETIDDLVHYMQYAMSIYGWPLHIFDNLLCGVCQICRVTCCACKFRSASEMTSTAGEREPHFQDDNCCMCGLGVIRLQTHLPEAHVLYASFTNKIFLAPFSICYDDSRHAIVLTVRGTLSINDALTDLTVSMEEMKPEHKVGCVEGSQYVHKGMYETANLILCEINEKCLLKREFEKPQFKDCTLVLAGHSLGAGVVSVLSIILKQDYPNLVCYAFSPPGSTFSFPLARYSRDFITSVVLGNDIIPRVTIQSLFYLRWQINHLLRKCHRPKFQVLCWSDCLDSLPSKLLHFMNKPEDVEIDEAARRKALEIKLMRQVSQRKDYIKEMVVEDASYSTLSSVDFRGNHVHGYVRGIVEGCQIPAFLPGKIIHIHKQSKKSCLQWCTPEEQEVRYLNGEDLAVIIVASGLIDDHLPNKVLAALKRYQKTLRAQGYRSTAKEMRKETYRCESSTSV